MQSVFIFAQGQLASLKQSSPGLREQLRDRLQSVMQAHRIPLSTHVPSSLLPLQQDVAEFLKSQVILPLSQQGDSHKTAIDSQKVTQFLTNF